MYQKTIIVGHTGRDAEMRYTPSGVPVTDFSARHHPPLDQRQRRDPGENDLVQDHLLAQAGRNRRAVHQKGKLILVEGDVEASAFTGRDGEARATLELTATNIKFLGGRRDAPATTPKAKATCRKSEVTTRSRSDPLSNCIHSLTGTVGEPRSRWQRRGSAPVQIRCTVSTL